MTNNTIRIRTGVAVFNSDMELLLVPHYVGGAPNHKVLWYLPGGGVDFLERIEDAAVREYKEETGFDIKLISSAETIQYIDPSEPWHNITFLYKAEIIGGELQAEASVWGDKLPVWFSLAALSELEVVGYLKEWVLGSFDSCNK